MLSLKKNEYMISEKDVPWLFERLRSENDLAGVALVQNPSEDLAAVAALPSAADSQDAAVAAPPQRGGLTREHVLDRERGSTDARKNLPPPAL